MFFPRYGEPKGSVLGCVTKDDYLLDDNSEVLRKWDGTGVKIYTAVNGNHGTWRGYSVNANMTADALGPLTIEKMAQSGMASYTSMIVPGVFAQTGMESCEIIQGIVQQTSPDCIITIDALAARSAFRLGTTVQLTDTGIRPGSGVGNARKGITKENMKIPVIAIGIPTVVSAAAIVSDAMDSLKQIGYNETILGSIAMLDKEEYYQLISEVFAPELGSLFVMPKNLDEELDTMSSLLAASLSQVICKR